jgi:hypothetical protein
MEVGMTLFEVFQKTSYGLASRGKDGQADHNEKYSLKDGKEQTDDPEANKGPADDHYYNFLESIHLADPVA